MSEQAKKEVFEYLVQEYGKLEAEWWSAQQRKDHTTASIASAEQKKILATAQTFGFDIKQLEMIGWGHSLDILTA